MLTFLTRFAFLLLGLLALIEAWLPLRHDQVRIDRHTSNETTRTVRSDTNYKLQLIGGRVSSCSVGFNTYSSLKDGDQVEIDTTRFLKNCARIAKGDEVLESGKHWRAVETIFGLLALAVAFGWIGIGDENRTQIN